MLIGKYKEKYLEARKSGKTFQERKHYLDMIEAGKRVMKLPPLIDDIEQQREEIFARTEKLLEQIEMKKLYGITTTD